VAKRALVVDEDGKRRRVGADDVAENGERRIGDVVVATDAAARTADAGRAASDSVAVSDAVSRVQDADRAAGDTVAVTDGASAGFEFSRAGVDAADAADAVARALDAVRDGADAIVVGDAAARSATFGRTIADTVVATDAAARTLDAPRSVADTVVATDAAARTATLGRTMADTVDVPVDVVARSLDASRSASDTADATDAATVAISYGRTMADSVVVTDAVTTFSPLDLSPALWLDGDDVATFTKDGSNLVSQWNDKSGNARHVSQATGTKQPTWTAAAINGRAAPDFDGGDTLTNLTAGGVFSGTSGEIWVVASADTLDGNRRYYLSSSDEASSVRFFSVSHNGNTQVPNNFPDINQRNSDTADGVKGNAAVTPTGATKILRFSSTGTAYGIEVNGVTHTLSVTSGSNNGDWFGDTANRDNFMIGAIKTSNPEGSYYAGKLAEILVFEAPLSSDNATALRNHLAAKWGVTL